jgi:predicted nucleotidyltransferase
MNFKNWLKIDLAQKSGFDSTNLFLEMVAIGEDQRQPIQKALQWIKDNKISCVIIGGIAVVHYIHGSRPLTPDLDVLTSELPKIKELSDQQNLRTSPLAFVGEQQGLTIQDFNADFLDARTGNVALNKYILDTAVSATIGSESFPVISPEALVILKFNLGRDKDDTDALLLLKSQKVNRQKYLQGISLLKKHLQEPSTLKMYADMIVA